MATWPATLPDFTQFHISGGFGEGRSVTPSDSGRMQVRVISGSPPHTLEVSQDYTGTQMDDLAFFYFITCEGGALPFDHVNLFNGSSTTYQFKPDAPPPQFSHIISSLRAGPRTGWLWRVRFSLLWLV